MDHLKGGAGIGQPQAGAVPRAPQWKGSSEPGTFWATRQDSRPSAKGHSQPTVTMLGGTQPRSPASPAAPTDVPTGRARPEASSKGACRQSPLGGSWVSADARGRGRHTPFLERARGCCSLPEPRQVREDGLFVVGCAAELGLSGSGRVSRVTGQAGPRDVSARRPLGPLV